MMRSANWFAAAALLLTAPAHALTRHWDNGGADIDWFTAANWSPNGVPLASDDLVLDLSLNVIQAYALVTLDNGGSFTVDRSTARVIFENNLNVGDNGIGGLTINSGTINTNVDLNFGFGSNGSGTGLVTGSASQIFFTALNSGYNGDGELTIANGARVLRNGSGRVNIGYAGGSSGEIVVTGAGSRLDTGIVDVGRCGSGRLEVDDGAVMTGSSFLYVGHNNGSNGTLVIKDGGSVSNTTGRVGFANGSTGWVFLGFGAGASSGGTWSNDGSLYLGTSGTAHVQAYKGSVIESTGLAVVGDQGSGVGTVALGGSSTRWTVGTTGDANLTLARAGSATVSLSSGALIEAGDTMLAEQAGSSASVSVSGAGTLLDVGELTVAGFGSAALTISDGAQVLAGDVLVGRGTSVAPGGNSGGDGTITLESGGSLSASAITLGNVSGTDGPTALLESTSNTGVVVDVTGDVEIGEGAELRFRGMLNVGGDYIVSHGLQTLAFADVDVAGDMIVRGSAPLGAMTSTDLLLGGLHFDPQSMPAASAIVVDGGRSGSGEVKTLDNSDLVFEGGAVTLTNGAFVSGLDGRDLIVGTASGSTAFQIDNGASVARGGTRINGNGSVSVSGPASVLDAGDVRIGATASGGEALLTVGGGSDALAGTVYVGHQARGRLEVAGNGTVFDTGRVHVGDGHFGTLIVSDGALLDSSIGIIADDGVFGDKSAATVRGAGSRWTLSGALTVGDNGQGTLDVLAGGVVSASDLTLGDQLNGSSANASGEVRVDGAGSRLDIDQNLTIGNRAFGQLVVDHGATLTNGATSMAPNVTAQSTVIVDNGSTWTSSGTLAMGSPARSSATPSNDGRGYLYVRGASSVVSGGANVHSGRIRIEEASTWVATGQSKFGRSDDSGNLVEILSASDVTWSGQVWFAHTDAASRAALTVDQGSSLRITDTVLLGHLGRAEAVITGGAGLTTEGVFRIGAGADATGLVALSGGGTTWSAGGGAIDVGFFGTGTVDVSAWARVEDAGLIRIGAFDGATGHVGIHGSSSFASAAALTVGDAGSGTLRIDGGGDIVIGDILDPDGETAIGVAAGGFGRVTVEGTGSGMTLWVDTLSLGRDGGSGTLDILDDAQVHSTAELDVFAGGTVNFESGFFSVRAIGKTATAPGGTAGDGTFNWTSGHLAITGPTGFALDGSGLFGSALTVDGFKLLEVAATTTIAPFNILTLDQGVLRTGALDVDGIFDWRAGKLRVTGAAGLTIASTSPAFSVLDVSATRTLEVDNALRVFGGGDLSVSGGVARSASLDIDNGGVVAVERGVFTTGAVTNGGTLVMSDFGRARLQAQSFDNHEGLVTGSGRIDVAGQFVNGPNGEIRQNAGETLQVNAAGAVNQGDLHLFGGVAEFTAALDNEAGAFIAGHGTLIAANVVNQGVMAFSGGGANLFGDIDNQGTGRIITSGGGTTTIFDDLVHNGTEIRTSAGARTVILGAASGSGSYTGSGTVHFEGDLRPGNSPGYVNIAGDAVFGVALDSLFEIGGYDRGELAGAPPDGYDAVDVGGALDIMGGTMDVVLYDGFVPQAGDVFHLISAALISGSFFEINLPTVSGLSLALLNDGTDIRLVAAAVPLPASLWMLLSAACLLVIKRRTPAAAASPVTPGAS